MTETVFRARRVITPDGPRAASLRVAGGRIVALESLESDPRGATVIDAGDAVVLPGLVDTHVHVNEPGRTDWEGFATATRAAAAGGVTTILDMPLNSIPATTSVEALAAKAAAAEGLTAVDVGFIGGVVPGNAGMLRALRDAGVMAFKCFLVPSGVEEFGWVTETDLLEAMPVLADIAAPLMVHAELPGPLARAGGAAGDAPRSYRSWLAGRPAAAEIEAVELMVALSRRFDARVHIVHLSAPESARVISAAKESGVPISAETCPHYLTFCAEEIPDGATEYKCAPAIGPEAAREGLWAALDAGVIEAIVSDHSPCPPALKHPVSGRFVDAWGGIASLQLGLSAVWTGARSRGFALSRVVEWMCAGPARIAGLAGKKGAIAPGHDADLVFFHPDEVWVVDRAALRHRHAVTPYHGRRLAGWVEATYLRGVEVYRERAPDRPPTGCLLEPPRP